MTDCLRFPLVFVNGRAATVVQDSDQDLEQRALLVLSYPLGACVDLPAFGTPDTVFTQGDVDPDVYRSVLAVWEPDIPAELPIDSGFEPGEPRVYESVAAFDLLTELGAGLTTESGDLLLIEA